jgi:hypothetical protein
VQQSFPSLLHAAVSLSQQDLPFFASHCFLPAQQLFADWLPFLQQSMDLPWQQVIFEEASSFAWSFIWLQQAHPALLVAFPEFSAADGIRCVADGGVEFCCAGTGTQAASAKINGATIIRTFCLP